MWKAWLKKLAEWIVKYGPGLLQAILTLLDEQDRAKRPR